MVQHENIDEQDTGNAPSEKGERAKSWQETLKVASPEAAEQVKSAQGGNKVAGGAGKNDPEDHPQSQEPQKAVPPPSNRQKKRP